MFQFRKLGTEGHSPIVDLMWLWFRNPFGLIAMAFENDSASWPGVSRPSVSLNFFACDIRFVCLRPTASRMSNPLHLFIAPSSRVWSNG